MLTKIRSFMERKDKYDLTVLSLNNKLVKKIRALNYRDETSGVLLNLSRELISKAKDGIALEDILVEAYALVNEAVYRVLQLNAFDVQIIAGIELHHGKIIEMQTGEGKTLAAVFPAYLNALEGEGVHILTFNDYLAGRDAAWMGPIFKFLGLSVGHIKEGMCTQERKAAYACDITYVTAKEAGFDYLRDSLCYQKNMSVHRPFHYAIVDEADSIMIDEAKIPLIIASALSEKENIFKRIFHIIRRFKRHEDYNTDEYSRNVYLTDKGLKEVEKTFGCGNLYDTSNSGLLSDIYSALHAEVLLRRDIDYIVKAGKIELVDEFTGRIADKRHWPDRLQAAVEEKEGISGTSRGRIMGSISIQNFINLYPKFSGMTGTAISSADEFMEFYGLDSVRIPPNKPCIREERPDKVFTHKAAKDKALIDEIKQANKSGRPVLIGTCSINESERLSEKLRKENILCQVLNAKNDELEAGIIANAGALGVVTVSTNMAGRGTDIKLGGRDGRDREKVVALGGLYVIGTNKHESIRSDNQLRGRAGRQGEPGASVFYICLEDDLLKKYGAGKTIPPKYYETYKDFPIEDPKLTKRVLQVQRIIEGQNFDIRKTLWKYSTIVEIQRQIIFNMRREVLSGKPLELDLQKLEPEKYNQILNKIGPEKMMELIRDITLYIIDQSWADYLEHLNCIRDGIHLVIIGGKNPVQEYFFLVDEAFGELKKDIDSGIIDSFNNIKIIDNGIDAGIKELKGPSSTWTYLINDNPFADELGLMLVSSQNVGFSAVAAGLPFLSIGMTSSLIYQRFFKKNKFID